MDLHNKFTRKMHKKVVLGNYRIQRLLGIMKSEAVNLPVEGLEAVICNDGVVIFDMEKDGAAISMIKYFRTVPFSLNLTLEEMQKFNGGAGLRERDISAYKKPKEASNG
jgi:hypothetical protein